MADNAKDCPHGYGIDYRRFCLACRADDDISELEAENKRQADEIKRLQAGLTELDGELTEIYEMVREIENDPECSMTTLVIIDKYVANETEAIEDGNAC